jgi:mycothiol synthase
MNPAATRELTLRGFDHATDLRPMVELISAVNAFDDVPYFPTVESLGIDWAPTPRFDPARDAVVAFDEARLVGAAQHVWRQRDDKVVHQIEVWVHPDDRRRGLGTLLLASGEERARQAVADGSGGPAGLAHLLHLGVPRHVRPGMAFAEARGYVPTRYGFVMRRDLAEPIPHVALPDGLEVRAVTPDQHRQIWDADIEAFRDHWEASVRTEDDFIHFFRNPDLDTSMWQVAWDGGEVAGSVMNTIYPEENANVGVEVGWLDHVSVRRPWRGRGLASALIAGSLAVLKERGMAFAALGVDAENPTGALGVYERVGFRPHQQWVTFRKPL